MFPLSIAPRPRSNTAFGFDTVSGNAALRLDLRWNQSTTFATSTLSPPSQREIVCSNVEPSNFLVTLRATTAGPLSAISTLTLSLTTAGSTSASSHTSSHEGQFVLLSGPISSFAGEARSSKFPFALSTMLAMSPSSLMVTMYLWFSSLLAVTEMPVLT